MLLSLSSLSSLMMIIILLSYLLISDSAAPAGSVPMKIVNIAGKPLELFWIDSFAGKKDGTGNSDITIISLSYHYHYHNHYHVTFISLSYHYHYHNHYHNYNKGNQD